MSVESVPMGILMRAFLACLLLAASVSANEKWDRFYESEVKGEWDNAVEAAERVLIVRSFKDVDLPEAAQWLLERPVLGEHSAHVVGQHEFNEARELLVGPPLSLAWEFRRTVEKALRGGADSGNLTEHAEARD